MHKIPVYQSASQHEHVGCRTTDSLDSHGIYSSNICTTTSLIGKTLYYHRSTT